MPKFHPNTELLIGAFSDHEIRRTLLKHHTYRVALATYFHRQTDESAEEFEAELRSLSEAQARELADLATREPGVHFTIEGPIDSIRVKPFLGSPVLGN